MKSPKYKIVVFGASGFVGRLVCRHLLRRYGVGGEFSWAVAGRSVARLQALRDALGADAAALEVIVADAGDETALRSLCESTRVVISTAGPYALYGSPLLKACAETGTDYCDLTAELAWMRRMMEAHEASARRSGARIVHACGFDSVPSDLGVHFLQSEAQRRWGSPCRRVELRVKALRGGFSGGTLASAMNAIRELAAQPALRKQLADPYALCPDSYTARPAQERTHRLRYDEPSGAWLAPFFMAAINTRVVLRSNALGAGYGDDFRYAECLDAGEGMAGCVRASAVLLGLGGFAAAAAFPPSRWLLEHHLLPKPGQGPSEKAQAQGYFDFRFHGLAAGNQRISVSVDGDSDPGYSCTAKILGEAAACLAVDVPRDEVGGGFWTPATALGDRLIGRLREHAGMGFEIVED